MRGAWTAVRRIRAPVAWKTAMNEAVKFEPRSRIEELERLSTWVRGSLDVASVQTGLGAEPSAPGAGAPALIARPTSGRAKR